MRILQNKYEENKEKMVTLTDNLGQSRGIYVPEKDFADGRRCIQCGLILNRVAMGARCWLCNGNE